MPLYQGASLYIRSDTPPFRLEDVRTAIRVGDRMFIGNPGEPHAVLLDRHFEELDPYLDNDSLEDGFVLDDGTWITRDQMEDYAKKSEEYVDKYERGHSSFVRQLREKEDKFISLGEYLSWLRLSIMGQTDVNDFEDPEALSKYLGYPEGSIASWENNTVIPSEKELRQYAADLGYDPYENYDFQDYLDRATRSSETLGRFLLS